MQPRKKAIGSRVEGPVDTLSPIHNRLSSGFAAALRHKVDSPIRHNLPGTCL